jgi:electron transport complex protein RnfC
LAGSLSAGTETVVLPPVYPLGLPEILSRKIGKGVLMKKTPLGLVGDTLVISVEDAVGMLAALREGKPMLDKTVTFSSGRGEGLKNYRARIGTPVSHVLEQSGISLNKKGGKILLDGMFRGYAAYSDRQPVTRTTEAIRIQEPGEVFSFQNTQCINCGRCNFVCPVDLEANLLGRCSEYGLFERCLALGAENCVECGLCAYVCPAHRPLVQLISHAKSVIKTELLAAPEEKETLPLEQPFHPLPTVRLIETGGEDTDVSER